MKKTRVSLKKRYRFKKKKPFFQKHYFWVFILILVILGTIFWWTVLSQSFEIDEIQISGNQKISKENIKNTIEKQIPKKILFFSSKSIFLVDLGKIHKVLLEEFPEIDNINLKRKFPNTLKIEVKERGPVAIFCQDENCFFIDRKGVAFEDFEQYVAQEMDSSADGKKEIEGRPEREVPQGVVPQDGINLIIRHQKPLDFSLGQRLVEKEVVESVLKIQEELKDSLGINVGEYLIVPPIQLNAETSEGWWIYFNLEKDIDWQITELGLVLKEQIPSEKKEELQYIDLRFDKILIYPDFSRYRSESDY